MMKLWVLYMSESPDHQLTDVGIFTSLEAAQDIAEEQWQAAYDSDPVWNDNKTRIEHPQVKKRLNRYPFAAIGFRQTDELVDWGIAEFIRERRIGDSA